MRHLKTMGLAAVAAAALMAFLGAGTASATVLCSANEDPCASGNKWPVGTVLKFSLKSGTSAKLVATEGSTLDTATSSSFEGEVTESGSSTSTPKVRLIKHTFGGASFGWTVTVLAGLQFHKIFSSHPVTLFGEIKFTIHTILFGDCVYGASEGTSIGEFKGGVSGSAALVVNAVMKKLSGSNAVCPETAKWTAEYVSTGSTAMFDATS